MNRRDFLRATAGATILGCGSSTQPHIDSHFTARPGTPSLVPTRGLTRMGLSDGRDASLYVPNSYDPSVAAPLFVGLHGSGGSSLTAFTSYYERAETRKMIFMAPSSRDYTWDLISSQVGPDIAFIDKALAYVFARCRIDVRHICLGGFSDGATYTLAVGLSNGDLFTHLAAYSPGFLAESDALVGKPRVYISHGNADNILPFSGTERTIVPSLRQQGYDTTFVPFDGVHEVPAAVSDNSLDWFLGK